MTTVAVLGAGQIGEALLTGLLGMGWPASDLVFAGRNPQRRAAVAARLGVTGTDTLAAVPGRDIVVIAVKPQDIAPVLSDLGRVLRPGTLVLSLCAGVSTAVLEQHLPNATPVVRAMPNTPMLVGEAMTAISAGRHATGTHLAAAERLLSAVGHVARIPESLQDAATAVSGSGPAYFYFLVEAMIDAGVLLGLPRELAGRLVINTAAGAATMLHKADDHPVLLRENITTTAGATSAALRELDRHRVRAAVADAIEAARDRATDLGGQSASKESRRRTPAE